MMQQVYYLPEADIVVITWASAEWAAMEHVFISSDEPMYYEERFNHWRDWRKYDQDLPTYKGWYEWGFYRLVEIDYQKVLLFKSNTHLDWPGEQCLVTMIERIIELVKPKLILSIGTAGGARVQDKLGTVNVVNAGTLYQADQPSTDWPSYANSWQPTWNMLEREGFSDLLFSIPVTHEDLEKLRDQFNEYYGTSYPLETLNKDNLDEPDALPLLHNLTPQGTPLLTTSTFVVASTSGKFENFACIEMDDAVIGMVCQKYNVTFGFVRNISDPAQNQELSSQHQGSWGSLIYKTYGFYTSYNGALAAWAIIYGNVLK